MGIGCGCDAEEDGEHTWTCFIVAADSVRGRRTNVFIPYFQSTQGWEVCSDLCPYFNKSSDDPYYMTGARWDELYMTSCEDGEMVDRDGFCSTPDEVIPGCTTMEEVIWEERVNGNWRRNHSCLECSHTYNINGEEIEHFYPPIQGTNQIAFEQNCRYPDCAVPIDLENKCAECHFFPYPLESPWDGPEGLIENPLDLGIGTVVKL